MQPDVLQVRQEELENGIPIDPNQKIALPPSTVDQLARCLLQAVKRSPVKDESTGSEESNVGGKECLT